MSAIPWMRFRKIILLSIFLEYWIALIYYFILFNDNYLSIIYKFLFPFFWVFILYVVGRYNPISLPRKTFNITYYLNQSLKIYASSLLLFFIGKLFIFNNFEVFYEFKNNLNLKDLSLNIFIINIVGIIIQRIIITLIRLSQPREQVWWVQGNFEKFNFLARYKTTLKYTNNFKFIEMPLDLTSIEQSDIPYGLIILDPLLLKSYDIEIIKSFSLKGFHVHLVSDWMEFHFQKLPSKFLSEHDITILSFESIFNSIQYKIKRVGDLLFSMFLSLFFVPIIVVASIMIKFNDGGPIFYSQNRSGFNGKIFKIFKLRTMVVDAEKNGISWSKKNDQRITTIGKFLRKFRLDEIPQIFNVIKGDMSLIGPRPERPEIENELVKKIPYYSLRNRMLPGLSGWAQVNYPYGASVEDSEEKLSFDLYYLRHFSIWLDILILFKTVRMLSNAEGSIPNV